MIYIWLFINEDGRMKNELKSKIDRLDNKISSYIKKSIAEFSIELVKEVNNYNKIGVNFLRILKGFKNFNWFNLDKWMKDIEQHINQYTLFQIFNLDEYESQRNADIEKCMHQINELYYGSYQKILENKSDNKRIKKKTTNVDYKKK